MSGVAPPRVLLSMPVPPRWRDQPPSQGSPSTMCRVTASGTATPSSAAYAARRVTPKLQCKPCYSASHVTVQAKLQRMTRKLLNFHVITFHFQTLFILFSSAFHIIFNCFSYYFKTLSKLFSNAFILFSHAFQMVLNAFHIIFK